MIRVGWTCGVCVRFVSDVHRFCPFCNPVGIDRSSGNIKEEEEEK